MEEDFEPCVVIKFCAKFGFTTAKMFEMVKAVYSESATSCATVECWHHHLKEGSELLKDDVLLINTFHVSRYPIRVKNSLRVEKGNREGLVS